MKTSQKALSITGVLAWTPKKISTYKYSQAILWQIVILNPQSILVLYFFMIISIHSLHLLSDITNIPNMLFRSLAGSTLDVSSRVSLVLCLENFVPCYVPFLQSGLFLLLARNPVKDYSVCYYNFYLIVDLEIIYQRKS